MKVESIMFLAPMGGHATIFMCSYNGEKETRYDRLEAPFYIDWEDGMRSKGVLHLSLNLIPDENKGLLENLNGTKAANWLRDELPDKIAPVYREGSVVNFEVNLKQLKEWQSK